MYIQHTLNSRLQNTAWFKDKADIKVSNLFIICEAILSFINTKKIMSVVSGKEQLEDNLPPPKSLSLIREVNFNCMAKKRIENSNTDFLKYNY